MVFSYMVVFTTTCISVYQYCGVFHPNIAKKFVRRCAVLTLATYFLPLVIGFGIYLAVKKPEQENKNKKHGSFTIDFMITSIVFHLVPTIIQVVLVACVLREILRFNKMSHRGEPDAVSSQTERKVSQPTGSDNTCTTTSSKEARKSQRELTFALCNIILWSFFAFGVMTFIMVVLGLANPNEEKKAGWRLFKVAMMFVLYLKSSVNFLILYFFVADFRNLFRQRVDSLRAFFSGSSSNNNGGGGGGTGSGGEETTATAPSTEFTCTFPFPEQPRQLDTSQLEPTHATGTEV
jgi:hypothetical protein